METIALEAARLILSHDGAGWVVSVLLGLACWHLHREARAAQEARIGETAAAATALERVSQTNATVAAALESRTRVLEELSRVAAETARGVARNDERASDKFDEILRRIGETRPRP